MHPAVGEGAVAHGHVERGDVATAEHEGRHGRELSGHAEAVGEGGHVAGPDLEHELRVGGVGGHAGGVDEIEHALLGVAVVAHLPWLAGLGTLHVVEGDRGRRVELRVERDVLADGLGEDEGLERRAGAAARTAGLGPEREVHLVGLEVATTDHRLHVAVLVDGDQRGVRVGRLVERRGDGIPRGALQLEVDRGVDPQPAAVEDLLAVLVRDLPPHRLHEVLGADVVVGGVALHPPEALSILLDDDTGLDRDGVDGVAILAVDVALGRHRLEHGETTTGGLLRVLEGVGPFRRADEAGEVGRLDAGRCRPRPCRSRRAPRAFTP